MLELILAQTDTTAAAGGGIAGLLTMFIFLGAIVLVLAGGWKMFAKAGQPGWAFIIPIVNFYFLLKIAGRPGWWLVLMLVPVVNLVVAIVMWADIAKAFGKGIGFALGLMFLGFIFIPVLGFGRAQYRGSDPAVSQFAAAA